MYRYIYIVSTKEMNIFVHLLKRNIIDIQAHDT